jgi:stage V sporulation protein AD
MNRTFKFVNKPTICSVSSTAGPKESNGCISKFVETKLTDDMFGEDTFEKAESKILYYTIKKCIENSNNNEKDIDAIISGDLLNQIIASTFSARNFNCGYLGIYNACATFTESLTIGATIINAGHLNIVICATSSHFSSAERQYRYPLELGCTRPPQAQWTVTGAGACMLSKSGFGPKITMATIGRVVDYGVTDANNMGAAMAPAALATIKAHFHDLQTTPDDYDLIVTGDLGQIGKDILMDLAKRDGINLGGKLADCGTMVFDQKEQDVHSGGSGCGCSAITLCGYLLRQIQEKKMKKILFCGTGALLSPLSTQQGLPIPGICHGICIEGA